MAKTVDNKLVQSVSVLCSASVGLTAYWVAIVLAHAYDPINSLFNFYPAVGPLLGKFIVGLLGYFIAKAVFDKQLAQAGQRELEKKEKSAYVWLIVATVVAFLMTYPPLFEAVSDWIS